MYSVKKNIDKLLPMRTILILFLFFSHCEIIAAHGGGRVVMKELLLSEKSVINSTTRTMLEHPSAFLNEVRVSTRGLKNHKVRISNFYKKNKSIFKDIGEEVLLNEIQDGTEVAIQLNEIQNNPQFGKLQSILSKKMKLNNLSKMEVFLILLGQKVHSYQMSDADLHKIYFLMSHSFAKTELQRMLDENKCAPDTSKKIKLYAKSRNIPLKLQRCEQIKEPNQEGDTLYGIVGLIFLIGIAYLIYKIFQRISSFIQNIGKPK